jgi:ribonuclease BN (tRNA processing enzyme)
MDEDLFCQIQRKYGLCNPELILSNLKMIWISHPHSDHCFGFYQLFYETLTLTQNVLPIVMKEELIH